jgi:hypothetical protein
VNTVVGGTDVVGAAVVGAAVVGATVVDGEAVDASGDGAAVVGAASFVPPQAPTTSVAQVASAATTSRRRFVDMLMKVPRYW